MNTGKKPTKKFLKTKRMRKLIKAARIEYRKSAVRDGVRHIRQDKLCSECDPLNCICRDNARSYNLTSIYLNEDLKKWTLKDIV